MGTQGMKASLVSRELVADSVEVVARGHLLDAVVGISGCDKTIPGMVMALARLNLPGLMLYGGSIMYGEYRGRRLTVQDVFEAIGAFNAGKIDARELREIESRACPGAGACGGQFTANTMATAFEMLGISPMGFNGVPAADPKKAEVAFESGGLVMELLRKGVTPRSIITKRALLNAIAGVMATGGSTNAVLHLLAVAREAGVRLSIDEFDRISRRTPLLADMKPWGRFTAPEMHEAGGMAVVAKRLLDAGLLAADAPTVTGRTIGDEARAARETPRQEVIRPLSEPIAPHGGIAILRGNLAPDGCVAKVAGHAERVFRGTARVFEREEDAFAAVKAGRIKAGDVIVGREPRFHGGPHRARGGGGRPDRGAEERRYDRDRRGQAAARRPALGRRDQEAAARGEAPEAAVCLGRDGQVRAPRLLGLRRRGHWLARPPRRASTRCSPCWSARASRRRWCSTSARARGGWRSSSRRAAGA